MGSIQMFKCLGVVRLWEVQVKLLRKYNICYKEVVKDYIFRVVVIDGILR